MEKELYTMKMRTSYQRCGIILNQNQRFEVEVRNFGFRGGFDSNSHGGQWTTEGNIDAAVIVKIIKDIDNLKNETCKGFITCIDLSDIELYSQNCA